MAPINLLFWVLGGVFIIAIGYLYFLASLSLMPQKNRRRSPEPTTKFAIIIPAHNEVVVIKNTLESIRCLNYPKRQYETIVIADNCDDETAQVVKEYGVCCFKRIDKERKGKGFALQWAFDHLKAEKKFADYDAFVIIDADTIIDPDFLRAMDSRIAGGEMAIQGYYDVINPEVSPMASLSYFGFIISRNLRFKGRTRMGWSNNLLGNGMCFSREVIDEFGWGATSIVEDIEYAVMLHLNGIKVSFAPEAKIFAEIPTTFKRSRIQRSRWDIGKFQIRNRYLVKLLKEAIRTRDISYLDTAMELAIPPFSLFVILAFVLFGLFMATLYNGLNALSMIWFSVIATLTVYVLTGLVMAKANWKTYRNLIHAPLFVLWRVKTIIWGYVFRIGKQWIKTERKE
ncbi:MAG: glycosyltransferase family 2 protein [Desulfobacteraceae bacterium]|nr:glycosyltransferase family 2 protein [Desulfobacteraceae bacterium]MBC2718653.1 glycosyltransferase family 2 protein [Desulfobacteraceae bacterium]